MTGALTHELKSGVFNFHHTTELRWARPTEVSFGVEFLLPEDAEAFVKAVQAMLTEPRNELSAHE